MVDLSNATEPVRAMLAYDRWANLLVVDRCAEHPDLGVRTDFDIGVGSLGVQLEHMAIVLRVWTDVLNKATIRDDPADLPWGIERLRTELIRAHDEFDAAALAGPVDETVTRMYHGAETRIPRATIVAHVSTHNAHHRAQCLHMLKRLGVDDAIPASAMAWFLSND